MVYGNPGVVILLHHAAAMGGATIGATIMHDPIVRRFKRAHTWDAANRRLVKDAARYYGQTRRGDTVAFAVVLVLLVSACIAFGAMLPELWPAVVDQVTQS